MSELIVLPVSSHKVHTTHTFFLFLASALLIFFASGCSSESGQTYKDYTGSYAFEDPLTQEFYQNVLIDISEVHTDTDTGTVKVSIPNLQAIYQNHRVELTSSPTADQIQKILSANLQEAIIEKSIDADLYKDGGEWKLTSTEQVDSLIAEVVDDYLNAVLADIKLPDITVDVDLEDILE